MARKPGTKGRRGDGRQRPARARAGWLWVLALWVCFHGSVQAASGDHAPALRSFYLADRLYNGGMGLSLSNNEKGELAWGESYILEGYLEAFRLSGDTAWLDKMVEHIDRVLAQRDDARGIRDYRGRLRAAWGSSGYTNGAWHAWVVHTGMITYPIAAFAAEVISRPELHASYLEKARLYLAKVEESVADTWDQWRDGPAEGQGHYVFPEDFPKVGDRGRNVPLNHQTAIGRTLIALYDATGNELYRQRAEALGRAMKSVLYVLPNDSYVWKYWPTLSDYLTVAGPRRVLTSISAEDISHAAISGQFAYLLYRHGWVFDEQDMTAIARTVAENVYDEASGEFRYTLSGGRALKGNEHAYLGRWVDYAEFDARVLAAAKAAYARVTSYNSGHIILGLAKIARVESALATAGAGDAAGDERADRAGGAVGVETAVGGKGSGGDEGSGRNEGSVEDEGAS